MTKTVMQISPIKTAQDHRAAVTRIEKLIGATPDSPEGDELDVLATLVDAYESKHHAIGAPSAIAAIEFRMDQQQLTRKDLEPFIGSRARVSEVLSGKRSLTLEMVRRLQAGLGISADLLIGTGPAASRSTTVRRRKLASRSTSPKGKSASLPTTERVRESNRA